MGRFFELGKGCFTDRRVGAGSPQGAAPRGGLVRRSLARRTAMRCVVADFGVSDFRFAPCPSVTVAFLLGPVTVAFPTEAGCYAARENSPRCPGGG